IHTAPNEQQIGKLINESLPIICLSGRLCGYITVTSGTATFGTRIRDFTVTFTTAILESLYCDMLLGHDFLVDNEVTWDYTTSTIHLSSHMRITAC
ncbi:Reverse transcriptase domain-containing protein, partial [Aphis craccivora]